MLARWDARALPFNFFYSCYKPDIETSASHMAFWQKGSELKNAKKKKKKSFFFCIPKFSALNTTTTKNNPDTQWQELKQETSFLLLSSHPPLVWKSSRVRQGMEVHSESPGEGAMEEKRKAGAGRSLNSHWKGPIMAYTLPTNNPTVPGEAGMQ